MADPRTYAQERASIEAAFNAAWTATTVKYENKNFAPPRNTSYVALFILRGKSENAAVGGDFIRHPSNLVTVQIFVPVGTGTETAMGLGEAVRAIFENKAWDDLRFRTTYLQTVGDRDGWYQVNAITPYERHVLR